MEGTPAAADAQAPATREIWIARGIAALGLLAGWWMATNYAWFEGRSVWPWLIGVLLGAVLGSPIFVLLGGAALVLFLVDGGRPISPLIDAGAQLTSPSLAAIPLFTLAGYFLAEGHASTRLLRLFRAFLGWMPGGTAIVTAALCAFFTTFTGGSGVTILALGGLLMPALVADRYSEKFSLGLLTAAGSLGLLFPPALPLILYAIIAEIAMEDLFLGGLIPGVLLLVLLAGYGVAEGLGSHAVRTRFSAREAGAALWAAKWEVLLPVIVLGTLLTGLRPYGRVGGGRRAVRLRGAALRPPRSHVVRRRAARRPRVPHPRGRRADHPGGGGRPHQLHGRRRRCRRRWSSGRRATSSRR